MLPALHASSDRKNNMRAPKYDMSITDILPTGQHDVPFKVICFALKRGLPASL